MYYFLDRNHLLITLFVAVHIRYYESIDDKTAAFRTVRHPGFVIESCYAPEIRGLANSRVGYAPDRPV